MNTTELTELRTFLRKAHLFELEDSTSAKHESDGSYSITYRHGPWSFRDTFFGRDPYGGHEIIHYRGGMVN